jgi:hypothetical protein
VKINALLVCGWMIALAACGGGSSYSSTNSTPSNATTAVVTVLNSSGDPINAQPVTLSTGSNGTPVTTIQTKDTNTAGQVGFTNLPSSGELCVSSTIGANVALQCGEPFPATVTLQF